MNPPAARATRLDEVAEELLELLLVVDLEQRGGVLHLLRLVQRTGDLAVLELAFALELELAFALKLELAGLLSQLSVLV